MTDDPLELAGMLASRICHDLISPLGAIGNGVELLGMSGHGRSPEVALIGESAESANARLRFFRVAFGTARADQVVAPTEVASILGDLNAGTKLRIHPRIAEARPRPEVKLGFLLLMCAETAMPWGGEIDIEAKGGEWTIEGRSDRLKIEADTWRGLSGAGASPASSTVQFSLAPLVAARMGRRISAETSAQSISIGF